MEQERVREHSLFFLCRRLQYRRNRSKASGNPRRREGSVSAVAANVLAVNRGLVYYVDSSLLQKTKDDRKSRRSLRIPRQTAARTKER